MSDEKEKLEKDDEIVNQEPKKESKNISENKEEKIKKEAKNKEESKNTTETKKEIQKEIAKNEVEQEKKEEPSSAFKKVENKKVKKKSKHTFLKLILIIIIILIIAYFAFFIRNYLIINDIRNKASKYNNMTNYSYITLNKYENGSSSAITFIRKDNNIRYEIIDTNEEENAITIWKDLETKEAITSFPYQKIAIKGNEEDMINITGTVPFEFAYYGNEINGLGLFSLIYTEEYNDKECYIIDLGDNYKKWIEKDTGIVLKTQNGENSIIQLLNVEINNVEEVYKPDLTGYEIRNK